MRLRGFRSPLSLLPPRRKPHKPCRLRAAAPIPAATNNSKILHLTSYVLHNITLPFQFGGINKPTMWDSIPMNLP